jgi:hypothetical protein
MSRDGSNSPGGNLEDKWLDRIESLDDIFYLDFRNLYKGLGFGEVREL